MLETEVGFIGGAVPNATYKQVCSGETGHAEAVRVVFDPSVVNYETLLDIFWANHDPTQADGQGPNLGSQYRSAVFFYSEVQEIAAKASREMLAASGVVNAPITTQILPADEFVRAEEYHQQYYEKQGVVIRGN